MAEGVLADRQVPAGLELTRMGEALTIALSGDWLLESELPAPDPLLDVFRAADKPTSLRFDSSALGDWNTGLIIMLVALHRSAEANGVALDDTGPP